MILDAFAGSGTTGVAPIRLNRRLVEGDVANHVAMARRRTLHEESRWSFPSDLLGPATRPRDGE